ncbi:Conserved_hypothetical protein [Hexamita inflata]|uniref:Uncharacterized protein n=1 Tax=Hexamita inflata TaxID=28002 RepID=A0ABP1I422_9EUKA
MTKTNEKIQSLSEYNNFMIQKYYPRVKDGLLKINSDKELKSLDFIRFLNIDKLLISGCKKIFPKLESKTIKQLELIDCNVFSVQDFILQSLEVLELTNYSRKEADTLVFEIVNFKILKRLTLYHWIINISPLSQMTRLTKLCLIECEIRSIEALKSLVYLEELSLSCSQCIDISNKGLDITSIQYLINLTKLSLRQCNLVALDALRPLMKLEELYIYFNNVVYLQPLAELKQLSKLDAEDNSIIDSKTIQHLNYQIFDLVNQKCPTKEQLETANIFKSIKSPFISLKLMQKQSKCIKCLSNIFKMKMTENLETQYENRSQFIARAAALLNQTNNLEDFNCQ